MIKIKVFKKKFYIESYFFAVCENKEDYFGFDLGGLFRVRSHGSVVLKVLCIEF